jgi:hypothetical protein
VICDVEHVVPAAWWTFPLTLPGDWLDWFRFGPHTLGYVGGSVCHTVVYWGRLSCLVLSTQPSPCAFCVIFICGHQIVVPPSAVEKSLNFALSLLEWSDSREKSMSAAFVCGMVG